MLRRRAARPPAGGPPPARSAAAEELDAVMRDAEPAEGRHATHEGARVRFGERRVQVRDAPARQAGEVMMISRVPVEAGVGTGQLLDEPLRDEQAQIPVHGAEADAGQPPPDHPMDNLGSRMRVGAVHDFEDNAPRARHPQPDVTEGGRRRLAGLAAACLSRIDCHSERTVSPAAGLVKILFRRPRAMSGRRASRCCPLPRRSTTPSQEAST